MHRVKHSPIDRLVIAFDEQVLRPLLQAPVGRRPSPAEGIMDTDLTAEDRWHIASLMRVNHAGEISAQALYQGQALLARDGSTKDKLQQSAREEVDHLAWCRQRLDQLGGRTSFLNPVWYSGSFSIGMLAGLAGDDWSLGFIEETERQVVDHLQQHLEQLPRQDRKTAAILNQMQIDEAEHGDKAVAAGARSLPEPVRKAMQFCSRVMTKTAYYI